MWGGRDAIFFSEKGYKVTALDHSKEGLKYLKERQPEICCLCQDIAKIKLKANSFDVVYAHLSLHYFDDVITKKIFKKIFNILKPGGLFFVKCKSVDDILYGVGKKVGADMYKKDGEWARHFFSKEYMKSVLSAFKIIKINKTSSVYHSYKSSFIEAFARRK